ncbi:MAG: filamentous hemagglutinin N-terminal domain-containing protein [Parachlamydiales bacterium]|nr:filamentous hemagglutinin N-terminal domain-containing protein [Parachlamydiales bacterium]
MRRIILTLLFPFSLIGNPSGPAVVHGEAEFSKLDLNSLEIRTSDEAIILWDDFSIGFDEITRFLQPNAQSVAINKVTSGNPSAILGRLEANGSVFLINPNGIVVGENGTVQTANFMAFAADIAPESLLKKEGGLSSISILPLEGASNINPFALAIQHKGKIDALGTKEEGGRIFLVAPKGILEIDGALRAPSGTVEISGEYIRTFQNAEIDVSGDFKGGDVSIGSFESKQTAIAPGSIIRADAAIEGDGGNIFILSEEATGFYGMVSARGGALQGNGGFIEISSKGTLDYKGKIDASAPMGVQGKLLLDPGDVTIGTFGASSPPFIPPVYNPASAPGELDATELANALGMADVTVQTTAGNFGSGDIFVQAQVVWNSAGSLTLSADRDIIIEEQVQCMGSGNISLLSGRDAIIGSPDALTNPVTQALSAIQTASGAISIDAGRNLTILAGTQVGPSPSEIYSSTGAIVISAVGDISLIGSQLTPVTGAYAQIQTLENAVLQGKNLNQVGSLGDSGYASITVGGNLTAEFNQNITLQGGFSPTTPSEASITCLENSSITARGNISLTASPISQARIAGSSDLTYINGNHITLTGGAPTATATLATTNGELLIEANGTITINSNGRIVHSGILGSIDVMAGQDIILNENATIFTASVPLCLIVDNANPAPPHIGNGSLYIGPQASVFTNVVANQPLRIFTASQGNNSILGHLQGVQFTPGQEFVNTTQEYWGIYFPSSFQGVPYTIFYKGFSFPSSLLTSFDLAMFEFQQRLFDYDYPGFIGREFWIFDEPQQWEYETLRPYPREQNGIMKEIL